MRLSSGCVLLVALLGTSLSLAESTTTQSAVRSIKLPQFDPQLPAGDGRNIVLIRCAVCHTAEYILNQPPLSRTVWTAEVTKMRNTYGAPMTDQEAMKMVDYLVAVRGSPGK